MEVNGISLVIDNSAISCDSVSMSEVDTDCGCMEALSLLKRSSLGCKSNSDFSLERIKSWRFRRFEISACKRFN